MNKGAAAEMENEKKVHMMLGDEEANIEHVAMYGHYGMIKNNNKKIENKRKRQ